MERRVFLQGAAACGAVLFGSALWPAKSAAPTVHGIDAAFAATSEAEALDIVFPGLRAQPDSEVRLVAPYLTTPQLAMPVRVDFHREAVQGIAITAAQAQRPLVALAVLREAAGIFGLRMRLEQTSPVTAYVLTGSGLFSASRVVKVTRGGYGMHLGQVN